jgi:hypothetical protein
MATMLACPNTPRGTKLEIVKRFLDQHPELRHYGASSLVAEALAEAFPCQQRPRAS